MIDKNNKDRISNGENPLVIDIDGPHKESPNYQRK